MLAIIAKAAIKGIKLNLKDSFIFPSHCFPEMVSKPQIRFKGKAARRFKAERTR